VIDTLELELEATQAGGPTPLQSWFERKTFTYSLGVQHPLYALLTAGGSA
jgi:m7GpppX diphosphatase